MMYFYMRNMQFIKLFNMQQNFSKTKVMKLKRKKLKMNEENLAHHEAYSTKYYKRNQDQLD